MACPAPSAAKVRGGALGRGPRRWPRPLLLLLLLLPQLPSLLLLLLRLQLLRLQQDTPLLLPRLVLPSLLLLLLLLVERLQLLQRLHRYCQAVRHRTCFEQSVVV